MTSITHGHLRCASRRTGSALLRTYFTYIHYSHIFSQLLGLWFKNQNPPKCMGPVSKKRPILPNLEGELAGPVLKPELSDIISSYPGHWQLSLSSVPFSLHSCALRSSPRCCAPRSVQKNHWSCCLLRYVVTILALKNISTLNFSDSDGFDHLCLP